MEHSARGDVAIKEDGASPGRKPRPPLTEPFDPRWDGVSLPREQWHFYRRLHERYGVVLHPGEYSRIFLETVKWGHGLFYETQTARVHSVHLDGVKGPIFVLVKANRLLSAVAFPHAISMRKKLRRLAARGRKVGADVTDAAWSDNAAAWNEGILKGEWIESEWVEIAMDRPFASRHDRPEDNAG